LKVFCTTLIAGHGSGFVSVPTDYYLRPLSVAMHDNHRQLDWRGVRGRKCTGPILEDELILNWVSTVSLAFFNNNNNNNKTDIYIPPLTGKSEQERSTN